MKTNCFLILCLYRLA